MIQQVIFQDKLPLQSCWKCYNFPGLTHYCVSMAFKNNKQNKTKNHMHRAALKPHLPSDGTSLSDRQTQDFRLNFTESTVKLQKKKAHFRETKQTDLTDSL